MAFRIIRKLDWTADQVSGDSGLTIVDKDHNPYIAKVDENETKEERTWEVKFKQGETENTVPVDIIQDKVVINEYKIRYNSDIPNNFKKYFVSGKTISLYDYDGKFVESGKTNEYGEVTIQVKNGENSYRVVAENANRGPYFDDLVSLEMQVKNSVQYSPAYPDAPSDYTEVLKFYDVRGDGYSKAPQITTNDLNKFKKEYFLLGGKTFNKGGNDIPIGKIVYVSAKQHLDENNNVLNENNETPSDPDDYQFGNESDKIATVKIPANMDLDYGWKSSDKKNGEYCKYGPNQIPIWSIDGFRYYDGNVENNGNLWVEANTSGVTLEMRSVKCSPERNLSGDTPNWIYYARTQTSSYETVCAKANYGPEREGTTHVWFNYNFTSNDGLNFYRDYISGTTVYMEMYKNQNYDFGREGLTVDLHVVQELGTTTIRVKSKAEGAKVTLHLGSKTGTTVQNINGQDCIGNITNGVIEFSGISLPVDVDTKVYAVISDWEPSVVYEWEPNSIRNFEFNAAGGSDERSLSLWKKESKFNYDGNNYYKWIKIENKEVQDEIVIDPAIINPVRVPYQIGEQTKAVLTSYNVQVVDGDGNPVYFEDLSAYDSLNNYRVRARLVETNYGNGASYTNYGDWEIIDPSGYTEEYTEGDGEENYTVFDQESIKKFTLGEEYRNSDGTYPSVELKITRKAETVTANWDIATAISVPASSSTYTFGDDAYITVFADTLDSNGEVDSGNTYIAWSGKIFNSGQKISAGTTSYVEVDDARLILPEHGASLSTIAITDVDGNIITPSETINSGGTGAAVYHDRNAQHTLTNGTSLSQATGMAFTPGENELVSLTETSGVTVNEILLTLKFD